MRCTVAILAGVASIPVPRPASRRRSQSFIRSDGSMFSCVAISTETTIHSGSFQHQQTKRKRICTETRSPNHTHSPSHVRTHSATPPPPRTHSPISNSPTDRWTPPTALPTHPSIHPPTYPTQANKRKVLGGIKSTRGRFSPTLEASSVERSIGDPKKNKYS